MPKLPKKPVKKIKVVEKISKAIIDKKDTYIKVPFYGVVLFSILLVIVSFFAGFALLKVTNGDSSTSKITATNTFKAEKTEKPAFEFFVMSFCPYGNQMETALRPVFDAIGNQAEIRPRYIFSKIEGSLSSYCSKSSPDVNQCETYVKNSQGQLKDVADCKNQIAAIVKECNNESQYLKIGNNLYSSLHGRVEANQDVREICAYNLASDKTQWWNFIANVNTNCTVENADTCWEDQAKQAGFDTTKITECFNKDAGSLIEQEIAITDKYQIQASPTLMLDGKAFPPTDASGAEITGSIKIGKKVFTVDQLRQASAIKEAICESFSKSPSECKKEIAAEPTAAAGAAAAPAAAGSCN